MLIVHMYYFPYKKEKVCGKTHRLSLFIRSGTRLKIIPAICTPILRRIFFKHALANSKQILQRKQFILRQQLFQRIQVQIRMFQFSGKAITDGNLIGQAENASVF